MSEQKTVNSILNDLRPVRSARAPVRARTPIAIRSSSRAPHRRKKCWQSAEKLKKKNRARKRNNRNAKIIAVPKKRQKGSMSLFWRWSKSNSHAYLFSVVQARSEPEGAMILPAVPSIAAFFKSQISAHFSAHVYLRFRSQHSSKFVWPSRSHERGTICTVKRSKSVLFAPQNRKIERCPLSSHWGNGRLKSKKMWATLLGSQSRAMGWRCNLGDLTNWCELVCGACPVTSVANLVFGYTAWVYPTSI